MVADEAEPDQPDQGDDSGGVSSTATGWLAAVERRPLLAVLVAGLAVAVLEAWWIARTRYLGTFDIDESGYLASALRFERNMWNGPHALVSVVGSTENGPLTPLLSMPFLLVMGRTAVAAVMLQPVLHCVCAVAVAGVTRHLGGRRAALVAGAVTLAFPAALVSAHSYQFGLTTGACVALAVWALLASDRMRRTWPSLAFGAAIGGMLLARTMTVGFLPAFAVAVAIQVAHQRRALLNLAGAGVVAAVVAAPWWILAWPSVSSYLLRNGYGDRSQYWGKTAIWGRFVSRVDFAFRDLKPPFIALGLLVAALAVVSVIRWRRDGGTVRSWPPLTRNSVTVASIIVVGYAALMSTSNAGSWFDMPIEMLLIAGCVGTAARLPALPAPSRPATVAGGVVAVAVFWWLTDARTGAVLAAATAFGCLVVATWTYAPMLSAGSALPRVRARLSTIAVVLSVVTVVAAAFDSGGYHGERDTLSARTLLVGEVADLQAGNFEADPRLITTDRSVRRKVSDEWAATNFEVVDVLQTYVDRYGPIVVTTSGSGHLMSINTVLLASEVESTGFAAFDVPDTTASEAAIDEHLTPTATDAYAGESRGVHAFDRRTRILMVIRGKSEPFPDDRQGPRFIRLATSRGWTQREQLRLPDGGDILFFDLEDR